MRGLVERGTVRSGMGCRVRPGLSGRSIGPCQAGQQFHLGVDVQAAAGTPVRAAYEGKVKRVWRDGELTGYGNVVVIQHPFNKMTLYAHLQSFSVVPGQTVRQGDDVARVGATGVQESGPHLHFESLVGTDLSHLHGFSQGENLNIIPLPPRVNPLDFLAAVCMPISDWSSL